MQSLVLALGLAIFLSACGVDVAPDPGTAVATQELGSYCYAGGHPIQCQPWEPDGDWNYCDVNCLAFESTDGYCPEATTTEWDYCRQPANYNARYCLNGQPQFPHYCVSGEFPLAPSSGGL